MEHKHGVFDSDTRFTINSTTRQIKADPKHKTTLMQNDHNSERFTFELPRMIEGHDMSICNQVEVHYLNSSNADKKDFRKGLYTVDDLQVSPDDPEKVVCSWLISQNATQLVGKLSFRLRFKCVEGNVITYAWHTAINADISVSDGINADETFEMDYVDIIEQWKEAIQAEFAQWHEETVAEMSDEITAWKKVESGKVRGEMTSFSAQWNDALNVERKRIDAFVALKDGSTTGDAELQDIRIGADGEVHSTAGTAVRNQFNAVDSRMKEIAVVAHDPVTNYIDRSKIKSDTYINGANNGVEKSFSGLYATGFISLKPGVQYYKGYIYPGYFAFYDENYAFVSGGGSSDKLSNPFILPEGAKYARFTVSDAVSATKCWVYTADTMPDDYGYSMTPSDDLNTAIRQEVSTGTVIVEHNPETNIIDRNTIIRGKYINGLTGVLKDTAEGLYATDYLQMDSNTSYYYGGAVYDGYCAFYDVNHNFISGYGVSTEDYELPNPFTTPDGTAYGRFTVLEQGVEDCWIHTKNEKPSDYDSTYNLTDPLKRGVLTAIKQEGYCNFSGTDIQVFRKGVCIGDSLTSGTFNHIVDGATKYVEYRERSYPSKLAKMNGLDIVNLGMGGASSLEWYEHYKDRDVSGFDFAIIQLGVNDLYRYGTWGADSVNGFTNIIKKLQNENRGIKIFVSTIIPAVSYPASMMDVISNGIRSLVSELSDEDVILLDMAKYGHTLETAYNCGHLSAYGYYHLAKDYSNYISYYINTHPLEFKEVQFIGTDYVYSKAN